MSDLIDREQALACFWNYANNDGTGYDETDMPAYDRLQALPIVAEVEDCISRQAAIAFVDCGYLRPPTELAWSDKDVVDMLKRVPSAQPEIIRCRDCKHYYYADNRIPQEQMCTCDLDGDRWSPDSYCSFAERKEDASNR